MGVEKAPVPPVIWRLTISMGIARPLLPAPRAHVAFSANWSTLISSLALKTAKGCSIEVMKTPSEPSAKVAAKPSLLPSRPLLPRRRAVMVPAVKRSPRRLLSGEIDALPRPAVAETEKRGVPKARAHRAEADKRSGTPGNGGGEIDDGPDGVAGNGSVPTVDARLAGARADEAGERAALRYGGEAAKGARPAGDGGGEVGDGSDGLAGNGSVPTVDVGRASCRERGRL